MHYSQDTTMPKRTPMTKSQPVMTIMMLAMVMYSDLGPMSPKRV
jgi:hypothetical protein